MINGAQTLRLKHSQTCTECEALSETFVSVRRRHNHNSSSSLCNPSITALSDLICLQLLLRPLPQLFGQLLTLGFLVGLSRHPNRLIVCPTNHACHALLARRGPKLIIRAFCPAFSISPAGTHTQAIFSRSRDSQPSLWQPHQDV